MANLSVEQLQETVAFLSHSAMKALEQVQQVSIANQQLAQAHQEVMKERDAITTELGSIKEEVAALKDQVLRAVVHAPPVPDQYQPTEAVALPA